jgi:hypothetical protein
MPRRFLTLACLALACATQPPVIEFDLSQLDAGGLRGPVDGKVAVSYEFKIPDTPGHRTEVRAIDPTVTFMGQSPGRIGAGDGECLCIGSTHQPGYRNVLERLAELDYINRIIECHFE